MKFGTKWKQLNQEDFNRIKSMIELGLKDADIHKITGRSSSTITIIKRSKDLEEYRSIIRAYQKPSEVPASHIEKMADTTNGKENVSQLHEDLQNITRVLQELVDAWKEKPKGLFR